MRTILIIVLLLPVSIYSQYQYGHHLCSQKNIDRFETFAAKDYPGDESIDAVYYFLDLKISTSPNLLTGNVTGHYIALENNLTSFYVDFASNMTVDSVFYDGLTVMYKHESDKLTITLPAPLNTGDLISVTIKYNGIPDPTGFGSFMFGSNLGTPSIWTLSQPYGSKDWWPCKDTPGDKADSSDVWINVPSNLTAVSNGTLNANILNPNGSRTFKWKNSYPIAPYLVSLAITQYTIYEQHWNYSQTDSMLVIHYIYPQNFPALKTQLDKTIPMLEFFSDLFGLYPFISEKYGHAEFGRPGGMEHQTISSMGAWFDGIIAHELAHQWFGDKLTCADWHNIWLNEGFATYGDALWQGFANGEQAYSNFISGAMADARLAQGSIYVEDISSVAQIFDNKRSYAKGAVVLHMLRGVLGDEVFFDILKTYANFPAYEYSTVVTADFQSVAESVSGIDLNYFFSQWIFGENFPRYIVDMEYQNTKGNDYKIDITISQELNTYPQYFTMPIEINMVTDLVDTSFTVFNNTQSQLFTMYLTGKPRRIEVDPRNLILKSLSGNIFDIPVKFVLEQNYPNPFNPVTTIVYEVGRVSNITIKVFDQLGREIKNILNEKQREGRYETTFDGSDLASGVYLYKLIATPENSVFPEFTQSKKMILLK